MRQRPEHHRQTDPYHDTCSPKLHGPQRVLWFEFSVWGSSDKMSAALRPIKNNLTFISAQYAPAFLFRSVNMLIGKMYPLHLQGVLAIE